MRKHISKKQNIPERATISLKKVIAISIIIFIIMGMMGVMANTNQVKNVKIILSSGYEMNVITSSTKVRDILDENNIVVVDGETVIPDLESDLSDNKTITITKGEVQKEAESITLSEDEILESYKSIVEKVVTVQEEIPFETITKDVSDGSGDTQEKVITAGSNGIKEVTYRIKYQNGNEIERTVVSENVIKEPVDKVVQVKTKTVTSRSSTARVAVTGSVAEYQAYAKERCEAYGWSEADFNALVALWNKESGWNPTSYNRSSGAYGIPQALPGSKMITAGSDWATNYKTQIDWGLNYIKNRKGYGTPTKAWEHSCKYGWY